MRNPKGETSKGSVDTQDRLRIIWRISQRYAALGRGGKGLRVEGGGGVRSGPFSRGGLP